MFALFIKDGYNPPQSGVIEENNFEYRFQRVYQIILPADVCQLVGKNGLNLIHRHREEQASRQEDYGFEMADDHWPPGKNRLQ